MDQIYVDSSPKLISNSSRRYNRVRVGERLGKSQEKHPISVKLEM